MMVQTLKLSQTKSFVYKIASIKYFIIVQQNVTDHVTNPTSDAVHHVQMYLQGPQQSQME